MDELYGIPSTGDEYADRSSSFPENLTGSPRNYGGFLYDSIFSYCDEQRRRPGFEAEETGFRCSEPASVTAENRRGGHDQEFRVIKAKIAGHPSYSKLLDAYIDCQKVGAPAEIAWILDEIRVEKDVSAPETSSIQLGTDPELDEFMEAFYNVLVELKNGLSRPFDEASSFLDKIEAQLSNLCKDDGEGEASSDEEETGSRSEDQELKKSLLHRYGSDINRLKQTFSKRKKKGKLPKEATQTLLQWWNLHSKWPYPTEEEKVFLAEATGLDPKQINNWFVNQRKRHWKPVENVQLAAMGHLLGQERMNL